MAEGSGSVAEEVVDAGIDMAGKTVAAARRHPVRAAGFIAAGLLAVNLIGPCSDEGDAEEVPEVEAVQEHCADDFDKEKVATLEGQRVDKVWDGQSMVMSEQASDPDHAGLTGMRIQELAFCFFQDAPRGGMKIREDSGFDPEAENILPSGRITIEITDPVSVELPAGGLSSLAAQTGYQIDEIAAANGFDVSEVPSWEDSLEKGEPINLPLQKSDNADDKEETDEPADTHGDNEEALIERDTELNDFTAEWGDASQAAAESSGIDSNILIAQAILSSAYGTSPVATEANNLLGMKARPNDPTNEFWDGQTYERPEDGEIFRKYDDPADSFLDHAARLTGNGQYAESAGLIDQPIEYIRAMSAVFAEDPEYGTKLTNIYLDLKRLEAAATGNPEDEEDLIDQESMSIEQRVNAVELTEEGYQAFLQSINTEYIDFAKDFAAYQGEGIEQGSTEAVIWHFTAVYLNGIGSGHGTGRPVGEQTDVEHFITSTDNTDGENCCGVQFLVGRDGEVYQLVEDPDLKLMHNPPFSDTTVGIEVEALEQGDLTTAQYQALAYLSVSEMERLGWGEEELEQRILGHAETREEENARRAAAGERLLAGRGDFPADVSALLRTKIAEFLAQR